MTMKDFVTQLKQIKGKFSLSYYDFEFIKSMVTQKTKYVWEQKEFTRTTNLVLKRMGLVIKELSYLIMNYAKKANTNSQQIF